MGRINYYQKTRGYNKAWVNLNLAYKDWCDNLDLDIQSLLEGYVVPTIKVRVEINVERPDKSVGIYDYTYTINDWQMEEIEARELILFRDKIADAIDGYIFDHEAEIVSSEDMVYASDLTDRIESLKPHWKPSEEQMRAVFDASERNDKLGSVLSTLYNDLKKL